MAERSLVPAHVTEEPVLSQKHKADLLESARFYLREHKIAITPAVLEKTLAVLSDALNRQLQSQSREVIAPKKSIRPLIKKGLELRENVRQFSEEVVKVTLENPTNIESPAGPYALSADTLRKAQAESQIFYTTAQISAHQEIYDLTQARVGILDRFAQSALRNLPPELQNVSLDRFPKKAERAKLVRNMIASYLFRGNFSPLITITDLKGFNISAKRTVVGLGQEEKERLENLLDAKSQEEKAFLADLLKQTMNTFSAQLELPAENNPAAIEQFYRSYSRDLLLLHPALEEPQIVTRPNKVSEQEPSLWDDAVIINSSKLPKAETLARAMGQARVRNDKTEEDRLSKGLKIWRDLSTQRKVLNEGITKAERYISERTEILSRMDDSDFELPPSAYITMFEVQRQLRNTANRKSREAERVGRLAQQSLSEVAEAEGYERWLQTEYGENLPESVQIPQSHILKALIERNNKASGQFNNLKGRLSVVVEVLNLDPIYGNNASVNLLGENGRSWLENELLRKNYQADGKFLSERLRAIYIEFTKRRGSVYFQEEIREFWNFWVQEIRFLPPNSSKWQAISLSEAFLERIREQRHKLIKFALSSLNEFKKREEEAKKAQLDLISYQDQGTIPDDFNTTWSAETAQKYVKEMKASKVNSTDDMIVGLSRGEIQTMVDVLNSNIPLSSLPKNINDRERLRGRIKMNISGLNAEIKDRVNRNKPTKALDDKLIAFNKFLSVIDHPLLPIAEADPIDRSLFLSVWKRRVHLAYAYLFKDELETESRTAQETYEEMVRENYKNDVTGQIQSKQITLASLKNRNLDREVLYKMRELDLVLE